MLRFREPIPTTAHLSVGTSGPAASRGPERAETRGRPVVPRSVWAEAEAGAAAGRAADSAGRYNQAYLRRPGPARIVPATGERRETPSSFLLESRGRRGRRAFQCAG